MKIALAQINTTVWDFAGNIAKIKAWAARAKEQGADLVVFPELCVCGYPPYDLAERPSFWRENREALDRLARELPPIPAIVGFVAESPAPHGKPAQNRAALLMEKGVRFEQSKVLLPTYDVLDERRWFEPAEKVEVFELGGVRIGLTVCEDAWNDKTFWKRRLYDRDPVEELAGQGIDVIINISASPFSQGKRTVRREMFRQMAKRHGVPAVLANAVGGVDELIFDGSSLAVDAAGEVRAEARSFAEDMVLFDTATNDGELHEQPAEGIEEVHAALVFGLREYVGKCGFERVVVGLSGGIDSSVVAALAVEALDAGNVTGIVMPGPYSSADSRADARALGANLGIELHELDIAGAFDSYRETLGPIFDGRPEDSTEENLQARVRGNLLMAYSNKMGALMLSTGNKSELAAGYCTLYGDLAGGLAVISDVPKTMVYELARRLNRDAEVIPQRCITREPTAELRPDQKDSDALPPYDVLDGILQAYVVDNHSPEHIVTALGYDAGVVADVVRRVHQSEYKRRQAPPGLKVTGKAFGPGRRFPIAKKHSSP